MLLTNKLVKAVLDHFFLELSVALIGLALGQLVGSLSLEVKHLAHGLRVVNKTLRVVAILLALFLLAGFFHKLQLP